MRLAAAAAAAVAAAAAGKEKSREIAEPHVFPRPALDLKTADYIMFRDMLKFVAQFFHLASRANDYGYYGFCISYPEFGQQLAMWGVLLNAVFKREARKYGLRFEEFKGEEWYHNDQLGFLIEAGRAFRVRGVPQCDCGAERVLVLGASAMRKVEEVVDWGVYGMNESEGEEIREGTGLKIRFVNWTVPEGEEYYGDDSEDSESGTSGSESLSEMEEEEEGEEEKEGRDAIMEGNGDDIMEDVEY